jgi:hypothetical protein
VAAAKLPDEVLSLAEDPEAWTIPDDVPAIPRRYSYSNAAAASRSAQATAAGESGPGAPGR